MHPDDRSGFRRVPDEQQRSRRGRPRDTDLTDRILGAALDVLAEEGLRGVTADALAARTNCGKAGIYRRWPDMSSVVAAAVAGSHLVPDPPDTGSLRQDLVQLLAPLTRPLDRDELAAAALLGETSRNQTLRAALDRTVVAPLALALATIQGRHAARGATSSPGSERLVRLSVQALWWERYIAVRPPTTVQSLEQLVDDVLLPMVQGARGGPIRHA